jgi:hypothetical protein
MSEVSVFDAYQVRRALREHLPEDDAMETLARDDGTGAYWVLTTRSLVLVRDQQVVEHLPREQIAGDIEQSDVGVTVRVRGDDAGKVLVGTFRKANRLTAALAAIVEGPAR